MLARRSPGEGVAEGEVGGGKNMIINMIVKEITIGEIITTIILAGTALIVWFYTRAMQKSNEIQERPVLNLYLREAKEGSDTRYTLRLRNVGNGPAYNIKFFGIKADDYTYHPYFDEANPILERNGDEKTIKLWVATPREGVEVYDLGTGFKLFLMRLFKTDNIRQGKYDKLARLACVFLIQYEGVNGNKYYSIFRIYSKIVPLLPVYDLVVEFITNRKGVCDMATAKCLCEKIPIMKKNEQ